MTLKEKQLNDQRVRYKNDWHSYVVAGDYWLMGYKQALANLIINPDLTIDDYGSTDVEVTFENGSHQIGAKLGKTN